MASEENKRPWPASTEETGPGGISCPTRDTEEFGSWDTSRMWSPRAGGCTGSTRSSSPPDVRMPPTVGHCGTKGEPNV